MGGHKNYVRTNVYCNKRINYTIDNNLFKNLIG